MKYKFQPQYLFFKPFMPMDIDLRINGSEPESYGFLRREVDKLQFQNRKLKEKIQELQKKNENKIDPPPH